jgi:hypothetical protein
MQTMTFTLNLLFPEMINGTQIYADLRRFTQIFSNKPYSFSAGPENMDADRCLKITVEDDFAFPWYLIFYPRSSAFICVPIIKNQDGQG